MVANHIASRMSALDLRIAAAVPPGGNWRDIPHDVPSNRLVQIRASAAAGEGSRSTYYGRLHPERPSYTINTYYGRPGNGCHLHYDSNQHRTLSHREAARLQSFPDSFVFYGTSQRSIAQQIGNAVPPLLAYQVALEMGTPGSMIDVFSGAGGLTLGFEWAGWKSIAACDIDQHAVRTFNANIAPVAYAGDMNTDDALDQLAASASPVRKRERLALIGGPPCQGFSTGGNRRSTTDQRNWLFARYTALVARVRPDLIVFENVLGLLSMDGGRFLSGIVSSLEQEGYDVSVGRLNSAEFGVPQKRQRVIITGVPTGQVRPPLPVAWSVNSNGGSKPPAPTVAQALSDLPYLRAGQDGSLLNYRTDPESVYQRFMRGGCSALEYLTSCRADHHDPDQQSAAVSSFARCA